MPYPPIGEGGSNDTNASARETLFTARSVALSQNPSTTDTPLQVEFGPAFGGVNDPVQIDALGEIKINTAGVYYFNITISTGRTGASGVSQLYGRLLVNGAQGGSSVLSELDNANVIIPLQFDLVIPLDADDLITVEIYRDSAGDDSGGLILGDPTLVDWSNSASAAVTVGRLIPASVIPDTPVEQRSNYRLIKVKADFPTPVANVITLDADTDYEINGFIDLTGDTIALNGSNNIFGLNPELDVLKTSSVLPMIAGLGDGMISTNLTYANTTGPIFDIDDTGAATNSVFLISCVFAGSASIGTFTNLLILEVERCALRSMANGVVIAGVNNEGIRITGNIVEDTTSGTIIDLGTSVCGTISIDHNFLQASLGVIFLSGLTNSGNIEVSGQGSLIANTTFGGNLAGISGISYEDLRWNFSGNNTAPDSDVIGSLYMENNATPTEFLASTTPTKVLGTTVVGINIQRFSMTASNQLTYDGTKVFNGTVAYTTSLTRTSGSGTRLVRAYIYQNGVAIVGGSQASEVDNREREMTVLASVVIQPADTFELWISNEDNTNDITVTNMQCAIR